MKSGWQFTPLYQVLSSYMLLGRFYVFPWFGLAPLHIIDVRFSPKEKLLFDTFQYICGNSESCSCFSYETLSESCQLKPGFEDSSPKIWTYYQGIPRYYKARSKQSIYADTFEEELKSDVLLRNDVNYHSGCVLTDLPDKNILNYDLECKVNLSQNIKICIKFS